MIIRPKPTFYSRLNLAHPLALQMTGCWLFNEYNGKICNDLRGRNQGAVTGATWAPGGILSDANYERVVIPNANKILSAKGTVAVRYKKTMTPSSYHYWACADDVMDFGWAANTAGTRVYCLAGGHEATLDSTYKYSDEDYHSLVYSWDDSFPIRRYYEDGHLAQDVGLSFTWNDLGSDDLHVGARGDSTNRYSGGVIDYFYAFNIMLTDDQIQWLHYDPYCMFYQPSRAKYFYVAAGAADLANWNGVALSSLSAINIALSSLSHWNGVSLS